MMDEALMDRAATWWAGRWGLARCGGVGVLFVAVLMVAVPVEAQVAAVTELHDNVAAVEVRNPSTQPMTVEIGLHHGEVVDGKLVLGTAVDAIVGPSAFRLEPADRQTVRVLVREDLDSGAVLRLVTTLTPIDEPTSDGKQTRSRIILATRLITKLVAS